jgi:hypothetical protein
MSIAPTLIPVTRKPAAPPVALEVVEPADHPPEAVAEERRWLLLLLPPFVVGASFFAAAIGTGLLWLMGPAMVLGPGVLIGAFVYLGLTSETNRP